MNNTKRVCRRVYIAKKMLSPCPLVPLVPQMLTD